MRYKWIILFSACALSGLLFCGKHDATALSIAWNKQYGNAEDVTAAKVIIDSIGNSYVVGSVDGRLYGSSLGETDAYIVKYDVSGTLLWGKQFGSSKIDAATDIALDNASGNVYICGVTYGDIGGAWLGECDAFLVKMSADGIVLWSKHIGTVNDEQVQGIAVDGEGNVYVVGATMGKISEPSKELGVTDQVFLMKYSSSGNVIFKQQLAGAGINEPCCIKIDNQGNIYIAGATEDMFGANGNYSRAFLAKLNASGEVIWGHSFGATTAASANSVALDGDGNIYVAGIQDTTDMQNTNAADGFLAKYDSDGNRKWCKTLSSHKNDEVCQVVVSNDNCIYVTGSTDGGLYATSFGDCDGFVAQYSMSGDLLWKYQFGSGSYDSPSSLAVDSQGCVYVCGETEGNLYATNAGGDDAFVVKFGAASKPTFSVEEGTHNCDQQVTVSCATDGARIRYTTDGTEPIATSTEYTGTAITVNKTMTLKAKAWKSDCIPSLGNSVTYTLKPGTPAIPIPRSSSSAPAIHQVF